MSRWRRLDAEAGGFAPAEFALGVGLLLFPLALLVLSLPLWVERLSLARLAAQEAARVVVLAESFDEGVAAGSTLINRLAANHGIPASDLELEVEGSLDRGGYVTANITVRVPALQVPLLGNAPAFTVASSHREAVDQYRGFAS